MRGEVSGGARADREEADRDLDEGSGLPAEDCRGSAHVALGNPQYYANSLFLNLYFETIT